MMEELKLKLLFVCALILLLGTVPAALGSTLVYENYDTNGTGGYFAPGWYILLADDMMLAGTERKLDHYDFTVYAPGGSGIYGVASELYTDDGGIPGTPIPGTLCGHVVSDGYVVVDCAPGSNAILPDKVWMVLEFGLEEAGWFVGKVAELGSTDDLFAVDDGNG